MAVLITLGTFWIRFGVEPGSLAFAWQKSNLCFIYHVFIRIFKFIFWFMTCQIAKEKDCITSARMTLANQVKF